MLKALCNTRINKVESPFQISQNMEYSKILNFNKVDDKRLNIVKPLSNVFKQIISKFMKDIESKSLPNYSNLKNYLIQAKEIAIKFRNLSSLNVDSDKTKTGTEDESSSLKKSSNFDLSFAK